ncbi:MAG: type II toxin-antitoxin system VapC family toxin [Rhodospirillales bacterium]|nr:type II toxin-antitoxin system VapC family toxin [Rhodospirillales bacterium]
MFVLDTNIVSELMRPAPELAVEAWVASRRPGDMYFSAVSEAELRYGIAILPAGRRRKTLAEAVDGLIREDFAGRVLPFDSAAARTYAEIAATRRRAGRPVCHADCQIAAIAQAHGFAVATRNVRDFAGMGVDVVDPWADVRLVPTA